MPQECFSNRSSQLCEWKNFREVSRIALTSSRLNGRESRFYWKSWLKASNKKKQAQKDEKSRKRAWDFKKINSVGAVRCVWHDFDWWLWKIFAKKYFLFLVLCDFNFFACFSRFFFDLLKFFGVWGQFKNFVTISSKVRKLFKYFKPLRKVFSGKFEKLLKFSAYDSNFQDLEALKIFSGLRAFIL